MMTLRTQTEEALEWMRDDPDAYSVVDACAYQTYPGSEQYLEPPEYCENDAMPGEEFCTLHTEGLVYDDCDECYDLG